MEIPRLSRKEVLILSYLIDRGRSAYGLEMVKASNGLLKRGTVYVTLSRMKDKGYVDSRIEAAKKGQQGPPRRLYWATGHGIKVYSDLQRMLAVLS